MSQIELSQEELEWLRERIRGRFKDKIGEDLVCNSNLKNYKRLVEDINERLVSPYGDVYVSANLFRKLFYDTADSSSVIFRAGFVNACYRFLSDGRYNRAEFLDQLRSETELDKSHPSLKYFALENVEDTPPDLPSTLAKTLARLVGYGSLFLVLIYLVLISRRLIDAQTIPWIFSPGPHHTLWVCEYEDGTQVFNRFRNYRTYEDAQYYFLIETRPDWLPGDCNAYRIVGEAKHVTVCYDDEEEIKRFEQLHGKPVSIRKVEQNSR